MTEKEMAKLIEEYELPKTSGLLGKNNKCPPVLKKQYRHFVEDVLCANSREELDLVRSLASDKLARIQDKLVKSACEDLMAGRISIEQVPLRREQMEDGSVCLSNIPPLYADALSFIMYLNDVWEWKYGDEKHTASMTVREVIKCIDDAESSAPGYPIYLSLISDRGNCFIIDKDTEKNMQFAAILLTDIMQNSKPTKDSRYSVVEEVYECLFGHIRADIRAVKDGDYIVLDSENAKGISALTAAIDAYPGSSRQGQASASAGERFAEMAKEIPEIKSIASEYMRKSVNDISETIENSDFADGNMTMVCVGLTPDEQNTVIGYPTQKRYFQMVRKTIACIMHKDIKENNYEEAGYIAATLDMFHQILAVVNKSAN